MTKSPESVNHKDILMKRFPEARLYFDTDWEDLLLEEIIKRNPGIEYGDALHASDWHVKCAQGEAFLLNHPRVKPGNLPR